MQENSLIPDSVKNFPKQKWTLAMNHPVYRFVFVGDFYARVEKQQQQINKNAQ